MTSKKEQFYIQRIAELEEQVAKLLKVNEALVRENAEFAEQIAKLSRNSSNSFGVAGIVRLTLTNYMIDTFLFIRILNTDICPTGVLLLMCFALVGAEHQLRRFIAL